MALSKFKPRHDLRHGLKLLSSRFHPNRTIFGAHYPCSCRICMSPYATKTFLVSRDRLRWLRRRHQMWDFRYCKWNFQGFQIFKNFYLKYFQKWEAVFQNKKKIRLDKYFVILSWKCAPVGKIKSFTVTSGLRISKFRFFYFISF